MFKIITNKRYDELEARTVDLARTVRNLSEENKKLKDANEMINHNNLLVLKRNEKLTKKLKEIAELTTCNTYNNEKAVYDKIKELVRRLNHN